MAQENARKSFANDILMLQTDLQDMGKVVDEMLDITIDALMNNDTKLARQVEEMDDIVDRYNLSIENNALHLLALQQPMAGDLRIIAAVMKIIADIERAGDYAVDIAKTVRELSGKPAVAPPADIPEMASIVRAMLKETLVAFATRDLALVERMVSHDAEVDTLYNSLYNKLSEIIKSKPEITEQAVGILLISRYLERMADHITNIGERIYYMQTGELKELHK